MKHTEDDQSLLLWVRRELLGGLTEFKDAVCDSTGQTNGGEPSQTPGPAEGSKALLGLRGGRRSGSGISVATASDARDGGRLRSLERCAKGCRDRPARHRGQLHDGSHLGANCSRTASHCGSTKMMLPEGMEMKREKLPISRKNL